MKFIYSILLCIGVCMIIAVFTPAITSGRKSNNPVDQMHGDPIEYSRIIDRIYGRVARELCQKHQLSFAGFGGEGMTLIRTVKLSFDTKTVYTTAQARQLLLKCAEVFYQHINNNRAIRPYLIEYPFPISRVGIAIYCNDGNSPTLSYFFIEEGKLTYVFKEPKGIFTEQNHAKKLVESYAEALEHTKKKITVLATSPATTSSVQNNVKKTLRERRTEIKQKMANGQYSLKQKYHSIPDAAVDAALDAYGEEIAEKYDLLFHRVGTFLEYGSPEAKNAVYGLSFQSDHLVSLEEGRTQAAFLVHDFLHKMHTDPVVRAYHDECNEEYKEYKYPPLITPEPDIRQICWKLAFWDDNVNRPRQPYLAEIQFKGSHFHYYVADPNTQALQLVLKETYDEAMKCLPFEVKP